MRTRARLAIGDVLTMSGLRHEVTGVVVYVSVADPDETWEEWALRRSDGAEPWIEYEHADRQVTLHDQVEVEEWPEVETWVPGQRVTLTRAGRPSTFTVRARGAGRAVHVEGHLPVPIVPGQVVRYAELAGPRGRLDVEKFDEHSIRVYRARPLDHPEEQVVLGRRISRRTPPSPGTIVVAFLVAAVLGLLIWAMVAAAHADDDEDLDSIYVNSGCTSRGLSGCDHRSVYGGGGGGLGK
ncbi:hypothetical protein Slu03_22300 [Sediminihabitans luteus]|nr:hypothetical protein Slu03_22300 [Sediminihabitans luteus]